MKRCEHCGGEYSAKYGSHCMANFRERAEGTVLLGQYVTRAEKAEAEVERLRTALTYLLDGRSDLPNWAAATIEDVLRPRPTSALNNTSGESK